MIGRTQWTSRVVTDTRGDSGAIILDEELVADWLDAGYTLDEAWIMDALTGAEITYEDRDTALAVYGLAVEFEN